MFARTPGRGTMGIRTISAIQRCAPRKDNNGDQGEGAYPHKEWMGEMTTKQTILKAIREHCLECCGGSTNAVRHCTVKLPALQHCKLYPYRFGKDPDPARTGNNLKPSRIANESKEPSEQLEAEEKQTDLIDEIV